METISEEDEIEGKSSFAFDIWVYEKRWGEGGKRGSNRFSILRHLNVLSFIYNDDKILLRWSCCLAKAKNTSSWILCNYCISSWERASEPFLLMLRLNEIQLVSFRRFRSQTK